MPGTIAAMLPSYNNIKEFSENSKIFVYSTIKYTIYISDVTLAMVTYILQNTNRNPHRRKHHIGI